MDNQKKIAHLNHFLELALQSDNLDRARGNLHMAEKLLSEIEASTLSNPWTTEDDIGNIVQLTRSLAWSQVQNHLQTLLNNGNFRAVA